MEQFESIKSKERVKELGEVFTPEGIVKDMLGLIDKAEPKYKEEYGCEYTESLEKTFLEPSCGTGNFLVQIVERKCKTAVAKSKINGTEEVDIEALKINLLKAVATTYGVDIMSDNVGKSRERVTEIIETVYKETIGEPANRAFNNAVKYIAEKNIIYGNTLENTMAIDDKAKRTKKRNNKFIAMALESRESDPNSIDVLEFSEWIFSGENIKRISYMSSKMDEWYEEYDEVHYTNLSEANKVTNPEALTVKK